MNRPALTLLTLCFFTFFLGLGRQAITDSDEGYYAEASREMVESGDWLTPRFNYQNRFEKPVLYYWLTATTYTIAGTGEAAARFWSAMSGVGLVLLTWMIASGSSRKDEAWLSGAIVATSFGSFTMARWALPDLPLAFLITLAIWASVRASDEDEAAGRSALKWWALAGLAIGLGFLMKGPVAVAIPAVVLIAIWLRERRLMRLRARGLATAALLFAIAGLPWYVLMWREHGSAYLQGFFVGDNVERFATSRFNDARPLWYYVPVLLGGMLPWSIYLGTFAWHPLANALRLRARPTSTQWRLLLWSGMPLLFYTISIGKQPRYILPVLPPLAILLAQAITDRIAAARSQGGRGQRGLTGATWATAALFVVLALQFVRMQPLFIGTYPLFTWVGAAIALCAALALAWTAATRAWDRLPVIGAVAGTGLLVALQFGALSGRRPEAVEQMAALVHAHRSANEPICIYNVFTRNLTFYTGAKQLQAFDVEQAARLARSPERILLIAKTDDVKAIEAALGAPMPRLGRVAYMNTANLRLRSLVLPDPMQEVAEVLLVANR